VALSALLLLVYEFACFSVGSFFSGWIPLLRWLVRQAAFHRCMLLQTADAWEKHWFFTLSSGAW
jgi:hypothetical protein